METGSVAHRPYDCLIPDPDGEHYCLITFDPRSIKSAPSGNLPTYKVVDVDKYPATITVRRWSAPVTDPIASWKTSRSPTFIRWHGTGKYLAVRDLADSTWFILNVETGAWEALHLSVDYHYDTSNLMHPTETGWFLGTPNRLMSLNFNGELDSTWLLGAVAPEDKVAFYPLATGVWIRNDGAMGSEVHPN